VESFTLPVDDKVRRLYHGETFAGVILGMNDEDQTTLLERLNMLEPPAWARES